MSDFQTHPNHHLIPKRETPREPIGPKCMARPVGDISDDGRCILAPWHERTIPHLNTRGERWGSMRRVDLVPEAHR